MGQSKITLYLDVVSPFAYEAFYILENDAVFKNVQKTYVPIFLGGLMKACGNTAPIQIKNKDKWIMLERLRWARLFGVPMKEPVFPNFPPLTLGTMRVLSALAAQQPDGQALLVRALARLYDDFWRRHAEVHKPDVYEPALRDVLGDAVADKAMADAPTLGKTLVKENTDRAFEQGAFGMPWMVCTNASGQTEAFWGVDHLGQLLHFMGLERPSEGGWKAML